VSDLSSRLRRRVRDLFLEPNSDKVRPEGCFLGIALVFGVVWIFLIPPFQTPDEYNHFYRTYAISEASFCCDSAPDQEMGYELPRSITAAETHLEARDIRYKPDNVQDLNRLIESFEFPLRDDTRSYIEFSNTCNYPPIAYLPQAIFLVPARVLDMPVVIGLWIARAGVFVMYLSLVYLAIRTMPFLKPTMVLVALMPMSLQQSVAPGADGIVISTGLLLTAMVLSYIFSEGTTLSNRQVSALLVLVIFAALSKFSYFAFAFLPILIPPAKFGSRRRYCGWIAAFVLVPFVLGCLWLLVLKSGNNIHFDTATNPGFLTFVREDPLALLSFIAGNIWKCVTMWRSYHMHFGVLGWLDTDLWIGWVFVLMTAIAASIALEPPTPIKNRRRLWIAIIGTLLIFAMMFVMTHAFLVVALNKNRIVQGRYYIPIILLAYTGIYLLLVRFRTGSRPQISHWYYSAIAAIVLAGATVQLIFRYYV
jgi:uncharacterized membrane protein